MDVIKIVDVAKNINRDRTLVSKAVKNGRLTSAGRGLVAIDSKYLSFVEEYKSKIIATTIPKSKKERIEVNNLKKEELQELESLELEGASVDEIQRAFSIAQAKEKKFMAKIKETQYKELAGELVRKDIIFHNIEEAFLIFNNRIGFEFISHVKGILNMIYGKDEKTTKAVDQIVKILEQTMANLENDLSKIADKIEE